MKKIIISVIIGALFGGVGVFMAIQSDFIQQNQVVDNAQRLPETPENKVTAVEDKIENTLTTNSDDYYEKIVENCITESMSEANNPTGYGREAVPIGCRENAVAEMDSEISQLSEQIIKNLSKIDNDYVAEYTTAQENWQIYRDKTCRLENIYVGTPQQSICLFDMTKSRIDELKVHVH